MQRIRAALPLFAAPVDELHAYFVGVCGHSVRVPGADRQGYDRIFGGDCIYSGDCIHNASARFGVIQAAELYGLVQILNDAMRRPGLVIRGCNEGLAPLSPMKRDVVER
jgi:hypothetical protein